MPDRLRGGPGSWARLGESLAFHRASPAHAGAVDLARDSRQVPGPDGSAVCAIAPHVGLAERECGRGRKARPLSLTSSNRFPLLMLPSRQTGNGAGVFRERVDPGLRCGLGQS